MTSHQIGRKELVNGIGMQMANYFLQGMFSIYLGLTHIASGNLALPS
jgi:hypothetical protein